MPKFRIIDVEATAAQSVEQLGTKAKFWFDHPQLGYCLCKLTRPGTGEDWSERVAADLAQALKLPHAKYDLGVYNDQRCVVSPKFLDTSYALVHGNELLASLDHDYDAGDIAGRRRQSGHTLSAIHQALVQAKCELPLRWEAPHGIGDAFGVFVGYLLLDAWIGNTDRHHENWAIMETSREPAKKRHLSPTFDHASSLGCHLTEDEQKKRLQTRDVGFSVGAYANKAVSALFDQTDGRKLRTMEAFLAAGHRAPFAAQAWIEQLEAIDHSFIEFVLDQIPQERITPAAQEFARRILLHNRERLLETRS